MQSRPNKSSGLSDRIARRFAQALTGSVQSLEGWHREISGDYVSRSDHDVGLHAPQNLDILIVQWQSEFGSPPAETIGLVAVFVAGEFTDRDPVQPKECLQIEFHGVIMQKIDRVVFVPMLARARAAS
ncbi:hypothetical protein [Mesorhizobium sp. WSM3866]|uniref:hypothetical protein n=1 Tax=Mesorhizobium sp. WSM3866 TaxID=422271 RepID=UPI001140F6B9|nr:hypothetical protein [Mesorhizobium sp. WSM3866]